MYERTLDLMDEAVFPRQSIYLEKHNHSNNSENITRRNISDEEVIASVTADMAGIEHK